MKSTLDHFVIHSGGNNQCDIEITLLAEMPSRDLGVDQSRDYDKSGPYWAEAAGRHSSVMNG